MEKEKLCLRCMRKIGNNTFCPYCRNDKNDIQKEPYLPLKTVVGGRYLVGKLVSTNGEGSTYNAFDMEGKKPVTLRELYPKGILSRGEGHYCLVNVGKASEFIDAKDSFLKLWRKLSTIKGYKALTPVLDVFEDLGTVYSVSEFLGEGQTLREYLLNKAQGYISWDEARVLFMPVLSAIGELHKEGIIHGGISPTTLVIDANGQMRITGYCTNDVRVEKTVLDCEIFDGYAAVEQYGLSSGIGTYTDIYAFAAVLYRTLIGSTPISAASRLTNDKLMIPGKFAEQLPAYVINALVNALQILPEDRTASADTLRDELSASPAAAGTAAVAYSSAYASANDNIYSDSQRVPQEPQTFDEVSDGMDFEQYDYEEEPTGVKKSTIAAFVISVVICLGILVAVLFGLKGCTDKGDGDDETTTEKPKTTISDDTTTAPAVKAEFPFSIPDFVGEESDSIVSDPQYAGVLTFDVDFVDSEEDIGVIVSQDRRSGTVIGSKTTIKLEVSRGKKVPDDLEGMLQEDAVKALNDEGFKSVKVEAGRKATTRSEENKVYSVVYENPETGKWENIPSDGRLSVSDKIVVYYYAPQNEETEQETTQADISNGTGDTGSSNDTGNAGTTENTTEAGGDVVPETTTEQSDVTVDNGDVTEADVVA